MDSTVAGDRVRKGYQVRAADDQALGTVSEVLKGIGDEGSYLHVRQGWLVKHHLYVPFDQVARVDGAVAFLRLAKDQLGDHVRTSRPAAFHQIPEREA